MIGQDLASAQRLVTGFKALIEHEQLSPERAQEFDLVAASALSWRTTCLAASREATRLLCRRCRQC
jgi:hypothetical protein